MLQITMKKKIFYLYISISYVELFFIFQYRIFFEITHLKMLQNYNSKKKKPFICIFPLQMMGRQYMFALSFRYILISCDVIWCSVENIFFPSLKSVQDSRPVKKHRITNLFTLRSITSFHNLYDCELFPTCHQCCSNRKETQQQAWPRWWSCPWRRSSKSARVDSKWMIVAFKEKTTRG